MKFLPEQLSSFAIITDHTVVSFPTAAFGINSILYQRGIYPPETFTRVTHYDMSLQLTTDQKLKHYLTNVVSQLKGILMGFLVGLLLERRSKYIFMDFERQNVFKD